MFGGLHEQWCHSCYHLSSMGQQFWSSLPHLIFLLNWSNYFLLIKIVYCSNILYNSPFSLGLRGQSPNDVPPTWLAGRVHWTTEKSSFYKVSNYYCFLTKFASFGIVAFNIFDISCLKRMYFIKCYCSFVCQKYSSSNKMLWSYCNNITLIIDSKSMALMEKLVMHISDYLKVISSMNRHHFSKTNGGCFNKLFQGVI